MNINFIFCSVIWFNFFEIWSQIMTSRAVFNQYRRICYYSLSKSFKSIVRIYSFNLPLSFICLFSWCNYLLKSGRFWMKHWSILYWFHIEFLWRQVRICCEANFLTIMNNIVNIPVVWICSLNYENSSGVGSSNVGRRIALISIFSCWSFIAKINN